MTSPFGFTSKTDGVDDHEAAHVNALQLAADTLAKSPDGTLFNGKLSVSVASNNITVAIKTLDGNDPSSSDPVYVVINGTVRALTVALSVTKNAGTNWFNSGATVLATKEVDYFVYMIWNTTPATDILDIGFARIPYARIYSDFSGTSTNEKYLASSNASAPNGANDCVVVGRFAATLSATASFNWSVPAFTSINLIQRPIYETRWLDFVPSPTGFSAVPTSTYYKYKIRFDDLFIDYNEGANGTSNATTFTATAPFAILSSGPTEVSIITPYSVNNGSVTTAPGRAALTTSTITLYLNTGTGAWTNANGKRVIFSGRYRI
jgi:hypothetical protein